MEIDIFSYRVRVERDLIAQESANVGDLENEISEGFWEFVGY
jgi:hypothetical protein